MIGEDLGLFQGVDIELYINDGNPPIRSGGTIVWVVKKSDSRKKGTSLFDTGIEFIDIRPEDRDRINEVVEKIITGSIKVTGTIKLKGKKE